MTDTKPVDLINVDAAAAFFNALFGQYELPDGATGAFAVRGVGEKDTPAEGALRSSEWLLGDLKENLREKLLRWASNNGGAFVVPAFVRAVEDKPNIHEEDVVAFTSILVDIDKGDPVAALKHVVPFMGVPSIVVESGGRTEQGKPKLHAYWLFSEPATDVQEIAVARELLAMKLGGDPSFGRVPQIIRIPGSVHLKGGVPNVVKLVRCDANLTYEAAELVEKIHEMQPAPEHKDAYERWRLKKEGGGQLTLAGGGLSFGPNSAGMGGAQSGAGQALTSDIHAGGEEDRTRWSEFSKVAGHYIHCARQGEITIEEALTYTGGWVSAHMVPPWASDRVINEFRGILNKDIRDKGPIAPPSEHAHNLVITTPEGDVNPIPENPLLVWAAHRWAHGGKAPERRWLVKGLLPAKKPSALVAEGGAGKTYASLELGLKIAGGSDENPQMWMGEPIPNDAYGSAVIITAEDDMDELKIRLAEIDRQGLRSRAGDRLIILPLIDVGGTFPLATSRKIHRSGVTIDEHGPTEKWDQLVAFMKGLPDLRLVVIDTMNATMHGEENSATVVQEYFRQATRVCGELGAALLVTHHFKKQNPKDPIMNVADAKSAFRGSDAIRSSVRQMITIWEAHDYRAKMESMGLKPAPQMLYRAAVTKANNREAYRDVKTLLRQEDGTLQDVTLQADVATTKRVAEARAWLLCAVGLAAMAGRPYTSAKSGVNSMHGRAGELPPAIKRWSARAFETTLNELERDGYLVKTAKGYLDIKDGILARGMVEVEKTTAYQAPDWSLYEYDAHTLRVRAR
jgi:hypothetical protein